jgi:cold shock CspA family protein
MQGTIHRLIRGKGFGFIQVEDKQFFFHHTEVRGLEFKELIPGDVVAFNYVEDEQGRNPRAVEVMVVEKKERPPRRAPHDAARAPGDSAPMAGDSAAAAAALQGSAGSRGPGDRAAPRRPARGPGGPARRSQRRGPSTGRPGFRRGPGDGPAPGGFAPRALQPGPADDGEFTEDLSAARDFDAVPAAPRRREARRPERTRDDPRSQRPRASGTPGERGEGVIRAMNAERGFGFIETPRGDIFFHKTSVRDGFESLNIGARVAFVFGEGERGSKAEDVVAM